MQDYQVCMVSALLSHAPSVGAVADCGTLLPSQGVYVVLLYRLTQLGCTGVAGSFMRCTGAESFCGTGHGG